MRLHHPHCMLLLALLGLGCGRFGFDLRARDEGAWTGSEDRDGGPTSGIELNDAGDLVVGGSDGVDGSQPGPGDGGEGGAASDAAIGPDGANPSCAKSVTPLHRYRFDGSGTNITDSIGTADGSAIGASLDRSGSLTLDGSGAYVDLPAGLISGLSAVTIVLWVEWNSGPHHQVLFDVGATEQGPNQRGTPVTQVQLTVSTPQNGLTLSVRTPGVSSTLRTPSVLSVGNLEQVAVVLEPGNQIARLYRSGQLLAANTIPPEALSALDDVDFWLGGTLDAGDADFRGVFHDARLYRGALDDCQIAAIESQGPDGPDALGCACP